MNNFFNKVKAFFKAPIFANNEEKTRRARLLHVVLVAQTYVLLLSMAGTVVSALNNGQVVTLELTVMATGLISIVFWRFLMSRGMVSVPSIGMLIFFVLSISMILFSGGTVRSSGLIFFPAVVVMATLLVNRRTGIIFFALVSLIGFFLIQGEINGILPTPDNLTGTSSIVLIVAGMGLTLVLMYLATQGMDEALKRANEKEQEVREFASTLEKRVEERTKALETSAEVSRRLASILDPRQLTSTVVNEVRDAYDYYYAQIYLFDDSGENLVLAAGTGEAGEAMLKREHSLPKGSGLVGQAAESNTSVLVSDTAQAPNWLPNDLLPDTKAEAAIPIAIGGQVLGVLDVQDNVTNDINSSDITLLESLANQVAISLNNARQFQLAQSLREQYSLAVESSNDGVWDWDIANDSIYYSALWKSMLGFEEHELTRGFVEWEERIHPEDRDFATKALEDYLAQRAPTYDVEVRLQHKDGTWRWIRDRGKALRRSDGSAYRMAGSHSDITERKHLESLTNQRARQQEAINLITQRIQSATTIEEAMQVAARELGHALGQKQTAVTLESSALGANGKDN